MKVLAVVFLAVFAVISVEAAPQSTRGHFQHGSAYRPHLGGTHFIARSGNGFHPRFQSGFPQPVRESVSYSLTRTN
jgi:hypothetical protein